MEQKKPLALSHKAHRAAIGYIGLLLPFVVVIVAKWRPVPDHQGFLLESISAYYYTTGVVFFVGGLFALSLFLLTYRGYTDDSEDLWLARLAALAAFVVAASPTEPPWVSVRLAWWTEWMGWTHNAGAVVLFGSFIAFSLWLFPRTHKGMRDRMSRRKKRQNLIYRICGAVMILSVAGALYLGLTGRSIFIPESVALIMFAISWLTKGKSRVLDPLVGPRPQPGA